MAYKTQMDAAKQGIITKEMETVALKEYKTAEEPQGTFRRGYRRRLKDKN